MQERIGVIDLGSNTTRLMDGLGAARFKDLILTARMLDFDEAAALGLVTRTADAATIDQVTRDLALAVAAHAPLTIAVTKEAMRRVAESRRPPQGSGDDLVGRCYGSADFKEGVAAFLAKRPPRWTGR